MTVRASVCMVCVRTQPFIKLSRTEAAFLACFFALWCQLIPFSQAQIYTIQCCQRTLHKNRMNEKQKKQKKERKSLKKRTEKKDKLD